MRRRRWPESVLKKPWPTPPELAHIWAGAEEICRGVVPQDADISQGLMDRLENHHLKACPVCIGVLWTLFGERAVGMALYRLRQPE